MGTNRVSTALCEATDVVTSFNPLQFQNTGDHCQGREFRPEILASGRMGIRSAGFQSDIQW